MNFLKKLLEEGDAQQKIESAKAIDKLISRYNSVNGLESELKVHVPREAITIVFSSDTKLLKQQASEVMEGVEDAEVIE